MAHFLNQGILRRIPQGGSLAQVVEHHPTPSLGRKRGLHPPWPSVADPSLPGAKPRCGFSWFSSMGASAPLSLFNRSFGEMAGGPLWWQGAPKMRLDKAWRGHSVQSSVSRQHWNFPSWASLYLVLRTSEAGHSTPFLGQPFSCLNISSQEVLPHV